MRCPDHWRKTVPFFELPQSSVFSPPISWGASATSAMWQRYAIGRTKITIPPSSMSRFVPSPCDSFRSTFVAVPSSTC